jgi:hypothetical protein
MFVVRVLVATDEASKIEGGGGGESIRFGEHAVRTRLGQDGHDQAKIIRKASSMFLEGVSASAIPIFLETLKRATAAPASPDTARLVRVVMNFAKSLCARRMTEPSNMKI